MVCATVFQHDVTAGGSYCTQKCTGFDAVRHHLVRRTLQCIHALNTDAAGAVAFNLGTHLDEHLGQVWNFWFLGRVFENGFTLRQRCSHQKILGASYGHHVGGNACTLEPRASLWQLGQHVAMFHRYFRTHRSQPFEVLVHRARADGATAWQGHLGVAKPGQQRPQCQH